MYKKNKKKTSEVSNIYKGVQLTRNKRILFLHNNNYNNNIFLNPQVSLSEQNVVQRCACWCYQCYLRKYLILETFSKLKTDSLILSKKKVFGHNSSNFHLNKLECGMQKYFFTAIFLLNCWILPNFVLKRTRVSTNFSSVIECKFIH